MLAIASSIETLGLRIANYVAYMVWTGDSQSGPNSSALHGVQSAPWALVSTGYGCVVIRTPPCVFCYRLGESS